MRPRHCSVLPLLLVTLGACATTRGAADAPVCAPERDPLPRGVASDWFAGTYELRMRDTTGRRVPSVATARLELRVNSRDIPPARGDSTFDGAGQSRSSMRLATHWQDVVGRVRTSLVTWLNEGDPRTVTPSRDGWVGAGLDAYLYDEPDSLGGWGIAHLEVDVRTDGSELITTGLWPTTLLLAECIAPSGFAGRWVHGTFDAIRVASGR